MLRLSKVLVLSLLVVCVASIAFATTTRVHSLAGTGNYINDDSNIFRWYGTLPSYTNMVMGEFGQGSQEGFGPVFGVDTEYQGLGFTHTWGEDHWLGTWAVFLVENSIEDMSFFLFNPLTTLGGSPTLGLEAPTSKFILMWGNEIDMLSYGFSFTRSDASVEVSPGGTADLAFTTIGGGIRADLTDDFYGDVAVTFGFAGGDTLGGFDSSKSFDIAARGFWEFRDDVTVVPYLDWNSAEYALDIDPNTFGSNGDKLSDITIGAALNVDVNTSNLLIVAAEAEFVSWEFANKATGDQSEVKIQHLPKLFVALESDINSWLTTRVGATKTMRKEETTDDVGDQVITTDPVNEGLGEGGDFMWYLGMGIHVGDWDLDAALEHDVPFRMGYWLTGYGSGDFDPPIYRISGTYRF